MGDHFEESAIVAAKERARPVEPSRLWKSLGELGLSQSSDAAGMKAFLAQRSLAMPEPTAAPDVRGADLASALFSAIRPTRRALDIVFIGAGHVGEVMQQASDAGFAPLRTGVGSTEWLRAWEPQAVEGSYTLGDLVDFAAVVANDARRPAVSRVGPPLIVVADQHGAEYPLRLPSPQELQQAGVKEVTLFLENRRPGELEPGVLSNGWPMEQRLEAQLQAYRAAGIEVHRRGLETPTQRSESELRQLDRPAPPQFADAPTFIALVDELWLDRAFFSAVTPEQAIAWLQNHRVNWAARGPFWSAQLARVDQAIAELAAAK
ncbi:MAG: hypothetical protein GQE15_26935 [Archangiaceae bacterium]|nr:hypothetical protein [Archangiaceae bacterium]